MGAWGCATGRLSEYDHPPEGNWLTLSPRTFVWVAGCVAAGRAEASALVATSAEVRGAPPLTPHPPAGRLGGSGRLPFLV